MKRLLGGFLAGSGIFVALTAPWVVMLIPKFLILPISVLGGFALGYFPWEYNLVGSGIVWGILIPEIKPSVGKRILRGVAVFFAGFIVGEVFFAILSSLFSNFT